MATVSGSASIMSPVKLVYTATSTSIESILHGAPRLSAKNQGSGLAWRYQPWVGHVLLQIRPISTPLIVQGSLNMAHRATRWNCAIYNAMDMLTYACLPFIHVCGWLSMHAWCSAMVISSHAQPLLSNPATTKPSCALKLAHHEAQAAG